jgi:RNA polymerase sigma-70 factor (ECF subfamily)
MAPEQTSQPTAALDPAAFARLYDECQPAVYAFAASRVVERSAAEEITATAFRRAIEVAGQEGFDIRSLGNFVFRVAASAVVDQARRSSGTLPHGVRAGDFGRDTDRRRAAGSRTDELAARAFAAAIDRRALRRAVERLPEAERRLIVVHYLDGLAVDEQCAALGWSRETFARRLHRALRTLHAALAAETTSAA